MMISTTFVLFLIWTLFPKFSRKLLPLVSSPHLLSNSLSSSFQSAYRMFHSTETTLLGIHNDLILAMDRGEVISLILLDLSAAFDTVDHSILLHRLQHWFGLHGTSWLVFILSHLTFSSSLHPKFHFIFLNLSCGVPQVPSLAHFFSLFIQLLLALSSQRTQSSTTFMLMIPNCTFLLLLQTQLLHLKCSPILSLTYSPGWTLTNCSSIHPKLNFLLIGTKQQRLKFSQLTTLSLGNDIIPVSSSARNLGFIFDSDMSFTDQINSLSKSCHFHIRDIRRIRHLLPLSAATALAQFTRLQQTWLL